MGTNGDFQPLVTAVEGFTVVPEHFIEASDTVVVEGRYRGKVKATGTTVNAQFAHLWQVPGRQGYPLPAVHGYQAVGESSGALTGAGN